MLTFVLALSALALAAAAASDAGAECDACVAGLCHSRRPILTGFPVTDQLAIDRANNILYLQLNGDQNTAIFLDDLQHRLVNMMKTSGMAVDQKSSTLYLGTKEVGDSYYKYNLVSNTTETMFTLNVENRKPDKMCYAGNLLYFVGNNHKGMNHYNASDSKIWYKVHVEHDSVKDFVVISDDYFYFLSNNTVYKYDHNNVAPYFHVTPIARKNYALSIDRNDDVFLADPTDNVIYKMDKATDKLEKYASYRSGEILDFVFDARDRVVLRDATGVAQWLPAPAHRRCAFDPQGGFMVKVV